MTMVKAKIFIAFFSLPFLLVVLLRRSLHRCIAFGPEAAQDHALFYSNRRNKMIISSSSTYTGYAFSLLQQKQRHDICRSQAIMQALLKRTTNANSSIERQPINTVRFELPSISAIYVDSQQAFMPLNIAYNVPENPFAITLKRYPCISLVA